MFVGLIGIVVPILPGLLLVWAAVLLWALAETSTVGWTVLAVSTIVFVVSQAIKYLVPGRQLKQAGVSTWSMLTGTVLGVIGFFVIPVVGVFVGFVLGIYLSEWLRLEGHDAAWVSTKHALRAVGLSVLLELVAGLVIVASWLVGVVVS
jgi:uncharacterized protein YqgC (DUF456 family)